MEQAKKVTEEWLTIYNTERLHEALNNMTLSEYKNPKTGSVIFYLNLVLTLRYLQFHNKLSPSYHFKFINYRKIQPMNNNIIKFINAAKLKLIVSFSIRIQNR
ncbi:integrase core domain-containing protein [Snodgrassella alvi]|uniref:integrase core domain-containing protein n=1 Tax=Snodgrassella alvi TaxID=1196083 RepID=UPI0035A2A843